MGTSDHSAAPDLLPDRGPAGGRGTNGGEVDGEADGVVVERLDLAGIDGPVSTLIHRPVTPGRHPAVVLGAEATGVNSFLRRVARTLAARGFVTALPDYYRGGGPADPEDYDALDDLLPHLAALDFTRATRDLLLAADALVSRPDVDPTRLGVWGYCTGATLALLTAEVRSDVAASVLFYPSQPFFEATDERHPPSPLDMLWALDGPALYVVGTDDVVYPPDVLARLRARIERWRLDVEVRTVQDAGHAFCSPDSSFYIESAAGDGWRAALGFLEARLAP